MKSMILLMALSLSVSAYAGGGGGGYDVSGKEDLVECKGAGGRVTVHNEGREFEDEYYGANVLVISIKTTGRPLVVEADQNTNKQASELKFDDLLEYQDADQDGVYTMESAYVTGDLTPGEDRSISVWMWDFDKDAKSKKLVELNGLRCERVF